MVVHKGSEDEIINLGAREWLPLGAVLLLILLIYSPIIANAFNGDDFVHLKWLSEAVKQPELVWRNFHSAWLDITTAKFYRPLISIFMLSDYVVWRGNGIGFHLTNVLCHLVNTCLLWLVLRKLPLDQNNPKWNYMWWLSAATLFGFYPLHPEVVSWVTGRVDAFVTLFSLASLYGYMRWRQPSDGVVKSSHVWFFVTFISMVLALMCKEMAVMLPAIFFAYEFIVLSAEVKIRDRFLNACKFTFLFWLLFGVYGIVRYFALGTLIGGYDNKLFAIGDLRGFISAWRKSLYILLFPFNDNLLHKPWLIKIIWAGLLTGNFALIIKYVFFERKNIRTFGFLLIWLVLTLVPVYKVFNIGGDLQGSRLAYLPTVPLSALLCFGYACFLEVNERVQYGKIIALAFLLSSAGALLLVNNSVWINAEATSQAIVQQLNDLSKTIDKNSTIYIIGLPDQINGAYVCRNAIDGMSKIPQISKNIDSCFNLDEINNVFPFGYARHSMSSSDDSNKVGFYIWDGTGKKLKSFSLSKKTIDLPYIINLKEDATKQADAEVIINLKNKSCFDLDCLAIKADVEQANNNSRDSKVCSLFYTNDIVSQFDNAHKLNALLNTASGEQTIFFPLHGQTDWAMGNRAHFFKLVLPKSRAFSVKNISFEAIENFMPKLSFRANGNQNDLGFIELNKLYPACKLDYDSSKVLDANKVLVEMTGPDQTFAVVNDTQQISPFVSTKKLSGLSGLVSLKRSDFASPGIYELRLRALDSKDKQVGIAGDHIVVTVK